MFSSVCAPLELKGNPEEVATELVQEYRLNERQEEAILTALSSLQNGRKSGIVN